MMIKFLRFFYDYLLLPIFIAAIYVASLFNNKIRRGIRDRKNLAEKLKSQVKKLDKSKKRIWFHSSSMGEFEQAKPVIEELRRREEVIIVVSFFSPSGYQNSINYSFADIVTYIPLDSRKKCKEFLDVLKIDVAVFMRYDIWPNMIFELSDKKIPTLLVDATMRYNSPRKYGVAKIFHHHVYKQIDKILTVSDEDRNNFLQFNLDSSKVKTVGDTRYDRVYQKSLQAKEKKLFKENFFDGKKVVVLGSAWESDEEVVLPALFKLMSKHKNLILIIAPHEPTINHLEKLEHQVNKSIGSIRFSHMNIYNNQRVILIDSIGILLSLYYYADLAFVGGGFKQNVHNVLEPSVYGLPVLFGPKIYNSQEALSLIEEGSARVVHNKKEAYRILSKLITDDTYRSKLGQIASDYVKENIGATAKITDEIQELF